MENPKYVIFIGKDKQFYFRLQAANGEPVLASEGYTSKAGCQNGIQSVKTNAPLDERYSRKTASNGSFYFTLTAPNWEIIGKSEMYTTEEARDHGIEVVNSIAPDAPIEDIS